MSKKLLFIGWDAADWKVIRPLLDAGEMPHLKSLIDRGCHGNIATMEPPLSPMLWTSIATGKHPIDHGIHGFTEPTRNGRSVRPVSNQSRTAKAFWNILNQNGLNVSVVGWWPSHPVEPLSGVMVSNHFREISHAPSAMPPHHSVHPPEWRERLAPLRVNPTELDLSILKFFCPHADEVDQEKDKSLHDLAKIIAETVTNHNAALEILEQDWDVLAVYHDSLDHFSHRFMSFHPPRMPWVDEKKFRLFSPIVANAYRYHDAMLGMMLAHISPDTTVMLVSDHGFHSDHLRVPVLPVEPAGPAYEHRSFGIFVATGPAIKKGEPVYGTSLLHICPTLLALCEVPYGLDMTAGPQRSIFTDPNGLSYIDSWEKIDGEDARLPPESPFIEEELDSHLMNQLVDLGYIAPPDDDPHHNVRTCRAEQAYNLARSLGETGRAAEAASLMEPIWEEFPHEHRFGILLADLKLRTKDLEPRARIIDLLEQRSKLYQEKARNELQAEEETVTPDDPNDRSPQAEKKRFDRRKRVELSRGISGTLLWLRINQWIAEGDYSKAREALQQLHSHAGTHPAYTTLLARAYHNLGDWSQSIFWCARALDRDPTDVRILALRAQANYRLRNWELALEDAVQSLSFIYFQPSLHVLVGACLWRLQRYADAAVEWEVATRQAPCWLKPYLLLTRLYQSSIPDPARAAQYQLQVQTVRQIRSKQVAAEPSPPPKTPAETTSKKPAHTPHHAPIVIVSGLPRSGTSLMMQMLQAGGVPLVHDPLRQPDNNNPRGYWEDNRVRTLAENDTWLPEARGRALKVVAPLLPHLPDGEQYFVLMMRRPVAEVVQSQLAMLSRLGKTPPTLSKEAMESSFQDLLNRSLKATVSRPNFTFLDVSHPELISGSAELLERIRQFLPLPFVVDAARQVIDPTLHRERVL